MEEEKQDDRKSYKSQGKVMYLYNIEETLIEKEKLESHPKVGLFSLCNENCMGTF